MSDDYEMEQGPDPEPAAYSDQETKPKRRSPRRKHDAYPTVDDLAKAIVERAASYVTDVERVVEPTAGDGAFVRAVRAVYGSPKIVAVDIVEENYREACEKSGATKFIHADFLSIPDEALAPVNLIVGNPPFNAAAAIVAKCVRAAPKAAIAFLLPVGFWGATKTDMKGLRRDATFWKANPVRYFAPLHPRPSFTGDGKTDRMEYGLFGFGGGWESSGMENGLGEPIVWSPR